MKCKFEFEFPDISLFWFSLFCSVCVSMCSQVQVENPLSEMLGSKIFHFGLYQILMLCICIMIYLGDEIQV
jgi:succinate-acetate transporter protein